MSRPVGSRNKVVAANQSVEKEEARLKRLEMMKDYNRRNKKKKVVSWLVRDVEGRFDQRFE